MKIFDVEVDFVNLRAEEVYESDSRIPTINTRQFGTPLEDTLRRDFTVNSLFYNVRARRIEDWTGRGMDDLLDRRIIETPLDPHVTFRDDPLRVLRAVRFAVRYDMDLADDIRSAATSAAVHSSLHRKVSRERVGKELEGMLSGKGARPGRALDLINGLRLAGSVFTFPPGADTAGVVRGEILGIRYGGGTPGEMAALRERGWEESTRLVRLLPRALESHNDELYCDAQTDEEEEEDHAMPGASDHVAGGRSVQSAVAVETAGHLSENIPSTADIEVRSGDMLKLPTILNHRKRLRSYSMAASVDTRILNLSVFLLPFHGLTFKDKKGKDQGVVSYMIKNGVKYKNRDVAAMTVVMEHVDRMRELLQLFSRQGAAALHGASELSELARPRLCRLETGLLIRSVKDLWVTCLLLATVAEMRDAELKSHPAATSSGATGENVGGVHAVARTFSGGGGLEDVLHTSREFYRSVRRQGLDGIWRVRPLLDGKSVIAAVEIPKGPLVSGYMEEQIKWMLLNPEGSKEECVRHLQMVKRKKDMEEDLHHREEVEDEQNETLVGVSDGGQSSLILTGKGHGEKHFSKRMHIESLDLL